MRGGLSKPVSSRLIVRGLSEPQSLFLPAVGSPVRTTPVGSDIGTRAVRTSAVEPASRPRRRAAPAAGRSTVVEPADVADAGRTWNVAPPVRTPEAAHGNWRRRR